MLEFISSIKWPVTVLLLAAMGTMLLKRNPGTRQSMGAWFSRRNLRLQVAGQEFEATVAETQGSIDLAAGNDRELAEALPDADASEGAQLPADVHSASEAVEAARRAAVESVVRNAVRLGWQWAGGTGAEPEAVVSWTNAGNPTLRIVQQPLDVGRRTFDRILRIRPQVAHEDLDTRAVYEYLRQHDATGLTYNYFRDILREELQRQQRRRDDEGDPPSAPQPV